MTTTKIEWAQQVWNPIVGCTIASTGCTNCYAQNMAYRLEQIEIAHQAKTGEAGPLAHYLGLTHKAVRKGAKPVWRGRVAAAPDETWLAPLKRKKPTRYFVNSMGDLFHPDVPDAWRDRAFSVMALAHWHTFIVLTKRADVMRDWFSPDKMRRRARVDRVLAEMRTIKPERFGGMPDWPLPNVWLGVTAENQEQADARIPDLLATPAAKRIVSVEPMLGPVDLRWIAEPDDDKDGVIDALLGCNWIEHEWGEEFRPVRPGHQDRVMRRRVCSPEADILANRKLDWVICGGESGPDARPMHPDWARSLRDQCASAGVPFFFKQWGEWIPCITDFGGDDGPRCYSAGQDIDAFFDPSAQAHVTESHGHEFWRIGKKRAGHLLDGVAHHEFP